MSEVDNVVSVLSELLEDSTVPKNVKSKIQEIIGSLNDNKTDLSLRINKALNVLDEISDDNNIQPYTRTQIWNIASLLESL